MSPRQRPALLALAIASVLFSTPSLAQQQSEPAPAGKEADETPRSDADTLDTITVTGSRVRHQPGYSGPAPVSTISAETISTTGLTQISDVVNQLPGFTVSQTNQTSNLGGDVGVSALDLRGMGVERTLTLVDGRRQVPSIPGTSSVDLSMLPSSLVQQVEVVTGGASALYGADAVNGVVNFILKKNFEGFESSVRYGNSSRMDMPTYTYDVLFGQNFADQRGNFTMYAFWERSPGSVTGADRPWTANGHPLYMRANSSSKYEILDGNRSIFDAPNAQVVLGNCTSVDWVPCLYSFDADGNLRRPTLGPGGIVNLESPANVLQRGYTNGGEYGGRYDAWYLAVPSDRQSLRSSFNFDFNDSARLFANVTYSRSQSRSSGAILAAYGSGGYESVPGDSPFITQEMIDANGGPITSLAFARNFNQELGTSLSEYKRELLQMVVGLEGDFDLFNRGWFYSGYYSWGRTQSRNRDLRAASYDRLLLGLDSTTDANGNAICRSLTPGCVAINPFHQLSAAERDWLRYSTDWSATTMNQRVASLYASGGVFNLPGGEAQLVVGAEYRKESNDIGVVPQYNPADNRYDSTLGVISTPLKGEYSVKEAYGELHLPLLAGRPFAESLSLDLAGRLSDYSTAGRTVTSKLGLEWTPVEDITLRATYGKAIRAPNIGELYTADTISSAWVTDPCNDYNLQYRTSNTQYTAANCATINPSDTSAANYWLWRDIIYSGNLALKPETAKTLTYGFVLRPRFVPNLALAVDYYRINLRDVISSLGYQSILNRCVDLPSLDNEFCALVTRDANNNVESVSVQQLNLAQSIARGVDINANWFTDLGENGGRLSLNLSLNRALERRDIDDPNDPNSAFDYLGLLGTPKWRGTLRTGWSNDKVDVNWSLRHVGQMRAAAAVTEATHQKVWAGNVFYNDLYASYNFDNGISLFGGLYNMFDRAPPRIPGAEAGGAVFNQTRTQAAIYDVMGRTFYVGAKFKL